MERTTGGIEKKGRKRLTPKQPGRATGSQTKVAYEKCNTKEERKVAAAKNEADKNIELTAPRGGSGLGVSCPYTSL